MSTRACYVFKEKGSNTPGYGVYKHHDGYPTGAADHIAEALKKAWPLPRWEADEFGAAFCAANKDSGGSVRLLESANLMDMPPDIEYLYYLVNHGNDMNSNVFVQAYSVNFWEARDEATRASAMTSLFECRLADFEKCAKDWEDKAATEAA